MKLHRFISRLQELNAFLGDFPPDTEEQETELLSIGEIMNSIWNKVSTTQTLP